MARIFIGLGILACTFAPGLARAFDLPEILDAHLVWRRLALSLWGLAGFLLAVSRSTALLESTASRLAWCALAWVGLSALGSPIPLTSWAWVGTWLAALGVASGVTALAREPGVERCLVRLPALWGVLIAGLGFLSRVWTPTGCEPGAGPYGNLTIAASLTALAVPALVVQWLRAPGSRRALWTIANALVLAYVFTASIRAAWLAVAAGAIGILATTREGHPRDRKIAAAIGLVAVLGLWLLPWQGFAISPGRAEVTFRERLTSVAHPTEGTVQERLILWENTVRGALQHPLLGAGPGRFAEAYPQAVEWGRPHAGTSFGAHRAPRFAHCDPLQVWLECGTPALALGLLAGWAAFQGRRRRPEARAVWLAFAALALASFPLYLPSLLGLLALGAADPSGASDRRPGQSPRGLAIAATLLALGHVGMLVATVRRDVAFERALADGDVVAATRTVDRDSPAAWKRLSEFLFAHEAANAAVEASREALTLDPRGPNTLGWHGQLLARLGRAEESLPFLRTACSVQPELLEARLLLAEIASQRFGRLAAGPYWEQLVRAIPWLAQSAVWRLVGEARLARAEATGDVETFRRAEEAFHRGLASPSARPVERCLCALGKGRVHLALQATDRWNAELVDVLLETYPSLGSEADRRRVRQELEALREKAFASGPETSVRILDRLRPVIAEPR